MNPLIWSRILNVDPDANELVTGDAGASSIAAQDTNITLEINKHARLRALVNTTNATGTGNFRLDGRAPNEPWKLIEVK